MQINIGTLMAASAGATYSLIPFMIILFILVPVIAIIWVVKSRANASVKSFREIQKNYGIPGELTEIKRIGLCIFLCFITFGMYNIIWMHSFCVKIKLLNNEEPRCGGELLCLIFVPFYSIYWMYTRGKSLYSGAQKQGIAISDNSTIFLLLSIFGLGIVSNALIQNDLNTIAKALMQSRSASYQNNI